VESARKEIRSTKTRREEYKKWREVSAVPRFRKKGEGGTKPSVA